MESITSKIETLEQEIMQKKEELAELRRQAPKETINDYVFLDKDGGEVKLSNLFQKELMVVHNMGKSCRYCSLWADELNGVINQLESRLPVVLVSPDKPGEMKAFAESRGWKFKMLSSNGNSFKKDMGFQDGKSVLPGVSIIVKDESGNMLHYSKAGFGPGDDFCSVFHYLNLLPDAGKGWVPLHSSNPNV